MTKQDFRRLSADVSSRLILMIVSGKMFLMCVNIHYELNASRVLLINSLTVHDSFALSREFSSCSAWQWMLSYVRYRFITACMQLNALFCCLWRNVDSRLLVINISSSSPTINTAAYYRRCVITCEMVAVRRPPATMLTTPGMLQR